MANHETDLLFSVTLPPQVIDHHHEGALFLDIEHGGGQPCLLEKPEPHGVHPFGRRRAFLVAGATFCAGLGLGGACGYAVGVGKGGEEEEGSGAGGTEPELASSGDALLDELRRLATKAPIEELIEKRFDFLHSLIDSYPTDKIAWTGVGRLAEAAIHTNQIPDRRLFARWLAQAIEASSAAVREPNLKHVEQLRQVK